MSQSGDSSKGILNVFWENLKQGWGIKQQSQDKRLEDIKLRRKNVLVWAFDIKNPKDNWDIEQRSEVYCSIMIQALDAFVFGVRDEDGKITRKMNKKFLDDARTDAGLVMEGARSPSMLKIPTPEDQTKVL